jgi:hypothetical protein
MIGVSSPDLLGLIRLKGVDVLCQRLSRRATEDNCFTNLTLDKMTKEELIDKWEKQIALHRRVCEDPLMYTPKDREKNSHYAQAICAVVEDIKQLSDKERN